MDDLADAWSRLLRVHTALAPTLDGELQRAHGLPVTWYDVLLELSVAPGRRLTMGELGDRAVVSRTRVSRVVDDLVRARCVVRETNPDDGRSSFAALTPEGRRRFNAATPTYRAGIRRHFGAHVTEREARAMSKALQRVLDATGVE
ncbi:MAG: MarR family winged helix-turn-helix transcriptional regulator [Actinomycetes bacterium]